MSLSQPRGGDRGGTGPYDVFKHLATLARRKSQTGQTGTLVNCRFSGHSSMQTLVPVLFLVEEEKMGGLRGEYGKESHLFFCVCVCFNCLSRDTLLQNYVFNLSPGVCFLTVEALLSECTSYGGG